MTMRKILSAAAVVLSLACLLPATTTLAAEGIQTEAGFWGAHRLGLGVNYWRALSSIDTAEVRKDGFSYLLSYQYVPVKIVKIEADLEVFPDYGTSSQTVLAPEAFVTVGGLVYAGAGIGIYYRDGDWGSAPFYMLRAGLDFPILPRLFLDINVNYRFNDWKTLQWEDLSSDTLRLGAALRFTL
jgi:hypothetical protein